jgi:hypothetical protein
VEIYADDGLGCPEIDAEISNFEERGHDEIVAYLRGAKVTEAIA